MGIVTSRFATFFAASAIFVPLVLLLDGTGLPRQLALGTATAAFVWYFVRRLEIPPQQIALAVIVATAGELILSVGAGFYEYRFALLPLYVPAGHGLFYALAVATARQEWLVPHERVITRATAVIGSVAALIAFALRGDQLGFLWWVVAAVILMRSRHGLVISTCIAYTTLLEYLGTTIGSWYWAPVSPLFGIQAANPPAGVGILYITLDVVVIALTTAISSWRPAFWERSIAREDPYRL